MKISDNYARDKIPKGKKALFIVENNSVPFDRRIWREAKTLRDSGMAVKIISPKVFDERLGFEVSENIEIYRYATIFSRGSILGYIAEYGWSFLAAARLATYIFFCRGGFHVIHSANPPDIYWMLAKFFKFFGVKYIFDEHDLAPEMFLAKFEKRGLLKNFTYYFLKKLELLSLKAADVVITTNNSYRSLAVKKAALSAKKIFVVRNGPDMSIFNVVKSEARWKFNRRFMVAYLGIMASFDGVDYLIRAAHYIVNVLGRRDIAFVLIGFGEKYDSLVKMTGDLGLKSYVKFIGRASRSKITRILSTADVCVDPDPYNTYNNYSTMTKIMEYMACQSPIVAFRLKENIYSAGTTALFVKRNNHRALADGIIKLLGDKRLSRRMASYGYRRVVNKLSWEKQKDNLINAYGNLFRP